MAIELERLVNSWKDRSAADLSAAVAAGRKCFSSRMHYNSSGPIRLRPILLPSPPIRMKKVLCRKSTEISPASLKHYFYAPYSIPASTSSATLPPPEQLPSSTSSSGASTPLPSISTLFNCSPASSSYSTDTSESDSFQSTLCQFSPHSGTYSPAPLYSHLLAADANVHVPVNQPLFIDTTDPYDKYSTTSFAPPPQKPEDRLLCTAPYWKR